MIEIRIPSDIAMRLVDMAERFLALSKEPIPYEVVKTEEPAPAKPAEPERVVPRSPNWSAPKPAPPKPVAVAPPVIGPKVSPPEIKPKATRVRENSLEQRVVQAVALLEVDTKAKLSGRAIRSALDLIDSDDAVWDKLAAALKEHPNVRIEGERAARTYQWRRAEVV